MKRLYCDTSVSCLYHNVIPSHCLVLSVSIDEQAFQHNYILVWRHGTDYQATALLVIKSPSLCPTQTQALRNSRQLVSWCFHIELVCAALPATQRLDCGIPHALLSCCGGCPTSETMAGIMFAVHSSTGECSLDFRN